MGAILVLACVYWFVPAGSLPTFMPGFFSLIASSVARLIESMNRQKESRLWRPARVKPDEGAKTPG